MPCSSRCARTGDQVSTVVQVVFWFSLAAGVLVLLAAISASQDERLLEGGVMRVLGGSRRQLRLAQASEFAAIGLLSGLVAAIAASVLAGVDRHARVRPAVESELALPAAGGGGRHARRACRGPVRHAPRAGCAAVGDPARVAGVRMACLRAHCRAGHPNARRAAPGRARRCWHSAFLNVGADEAREALHEVRQLLARGLVCELSLCIHQSVRTRHLQAPARPVAHAATCAAPAAMRSARGSCRSRRARRRSRRTGDRRTRARCRRRGATASRSRS